MTELLSVVRSGTENCHAAPLFIPPWDTARATHDAPTRMIAPPTEKLQLIDDLVVSFTDKIPRGTNQEPTNEIIQAVMKRSEADGADVVDCSDWNILQQYLRKELRLPNKKTLFKFVGTLTVGAKELPQTIWNATGLAALRRTLLREPLEDLQERAVVELDLVPMGQMPKPQASTPRTDKQKSHEKKRDCIQELVYGETKRQKNVEGEWTEMASLFMMNDSDLMKKVPAPTSRAKRSPLPTTRALSVAAHPSRGDVSEGHGQPLLPDQPARGHLPIHLPGQVRRQRRDQDHPGQHQQLPPAPRPRPQGQLGGRHPLWAPVLLAGRQLS